MMNKGETYRGIDFIRLRNLPEDQRQAIKNWLDEDMLIKIQTEEALLTNCILLKDYAYWFENIYTCAVAGEAGSRAAESKRVNPIGGLAFD